MAGAMRPPIHEQTDTRKFQRKIYDSRKLNDAVVVVIFVQSMLSIITLLQDEKFLMEAISMSGMFCDRC
jgi:hypothetical protein